MSELPNTWELRTLSELCDFNPRHRSETPRTIAVTFLPMPAVDDKRGVIIAPQTRTLSEVWQGYTHIAEGDVIFAKITPCMENGKIAVAAGLLEGLACGSTEFHVLRSKGALDAAYLWRYLRQRSFRKIAESHMTGAVGQRRVPKQFLEQTPIPVAPVAEQQRIVAKLNSLMAKTARAREELSKLDKLVSRFKEKVLERAFKSAPERVSFEKLLSGIKAGKNLKCVERPPLPTEKGVVKVSAVTWGFFDSAQSKTLPEDFVPDPESRIQEGDFLFSRANTFELVGAVVIVHEAPDNLYLSDKVLRLDFVEDDAKQWVLYYLRSREGRKKLEEISSGNQLSMRNISQKKLLSISIPYAPVGVRSEIVRSIETAFSKIDQVAAEAKRALGLADRLDEVILAKAFTGELVPQDPNDEPASVLIERIRAEWENTEVPPLKRHLQREAIEAVTVTAERPKFSNGPKNMEKTRSQVAHNHLTAVLINQGKMTPEALWRQSEMSIDEFYKQLRMEINASTIREAADKELEAA